MKFAKRLFAFLMAMVMVMGMVVSVSAAENPTITIPNDGHTYEVYQIFTATLSEEEGKTILSNIKWGKNGTGTEADPVARAVLDELAAVNNGSNLEKLAVITKYVTLSNPIDTLNKDKLSTEVVPGYYLIKDRDGSVTGSDVYTTYIVEVVDTVEIKRKATVPEVIKQIIDGEDNPATPEREDKVTVNEAAIGEDVNYRITGTLPSNVEDFKEYFYRFTDTLSKGLTYNGDAKVFVNDVDVTKYFYINASAYSETDGTTIIIAIQDLLALELLKNGEASVVGNITKDTNVVITYTAKVNENAAIDTANPNDVDLEYSNNPSDSGDGTTTPPPENPREPVPTDPTGKTPKKVVETFVTEIHINKVDGDGNALSGATFKITGTALKTVIVSTETFTENANGEYWKLKDGTYTKTAPVEVDNPETQDINEKTSDKYDSTTTKYAVTVNETTVTNAETVGAEKAVGEDGKLTFTGLAVGTYKITETVTPAGYNTIPEITLVVTFNPSTEAFSYNWTGGAEGNTNTVTVTNLAGSTLPETGGMGTTLIYAVGGILFAAAVVLLVTKKRMASEE